MLRMCGGVAVHGGSVGVLLERFSWRAFSSIASSKLVYEWILFTTGVEQDFERDGFTGHKGKTSHSFRNESRVSAKLRRCRFGAPRRYF